MENLIGKKMIGFVFKSIPNGAYFNPSMDQYNGLIGEVVYYNNDIVRVKFRNGMTYAYPMDLAKDHFVEDEETDMATPEQVIDIPYMPEGVKMLVSDDGNFEEGKIRSVIGTRGGFYYAWDEHKITITHWLYAKPLKSVVKKVTLKEVAEKFGVERIEVIIDED